MRHITSIFAGAMLLASILPASADEKFAGTISDGNDDIPVALTITATKQPGSAAGQIRFEDQWKCGFALQFSKNRDKVDVYSLQGAGSGRCIALASGYLHRGAGADGSTVIQLFDRTHKDPVYTVDLVLPSN
ncbi:hypothetical protein AB7M29_002830 [Pseudomonas sp. F-14 TE3623]